MGEEQRGYVVHAKGGLTKAPASGATVTLWTSADTTATTSNRGAQAKVVVVNLESSHDSATNGLTIEESDDSGVTWKVLFQKSYVAATDLRYKRMENTVSAPDVRVRYANSANTLTTFRYSILVDSYERAL